jgi:hypothetical protein
VKYRQVILFNILYVQPVSAANISVLYLLRWCEDACAASIKGAAGDFIVQCLK